MPNYKELESNLIDVVKEIQAKIGYSKDPVYLYYPLDSLNSILETDCDEDGMFAELENFRGNNVISKNIKYSCDNERFCIIIPEDGVTYIHQNIPDVPFLMDFLDAVQRHGQTLEDIVTVFEKYSPCVKVEKIENGEFDYTIYFEDGVPDKYRYCIKFEADHTIYHRFTIKDYEDLL